MDWYILFQYPAPDMNPETDIKLIGLIQMTGGVVEGTGTDGIRRDVVGMFPTKEAAEACGKAAWYLYIDFLTWEVARYGDAIE